MFRFPPLTPFVKQLMFVLFGMFVLSALLQNFASVPVFGLLSLEPRVLSALTPVQLFTHVLAMQPASGNIFPLLVSLLFLWLILAPFEARYGKARAVQLTVLAALAAALPALAVGLVLPGNADKLAGPQPITLAAMCAYAALLPPHAEVSFFGVVPMRAQYLLALVAGFSVLHFITSLDAAALAADLGAMAAGVGFVKWWMQRPPPRKNVQRKGAPALRVVGRDEEPKRWLH